MLFDVLPDGTLRLVSEEDAEMEREFELMDDVKEMLATSAWTEVLILFIVELKFMFICRFLTFK
jgi:hypothetical protein